MKRLKKKIIIYLTAITLILVLLTLMTSIIFPALHVTPAFPFILILYYFVTLGVLMVLEKSMQKRLSNFANTYMIATFLKLVFFTVVIIVYVISNKKDAVSFVVVFFVYYLIYTIFEVLSLRQLNDSEKS